MHPKLRMASIALLTGLAIASGAGVAAASPDAPPPLNTEAATPFGIDCAFCEQSFPDTDQGHVDRALHQLRVHWESDIVDPLLDKRNDSVRFASDAMDDYGNWFSEDEGLRIMGEVLFGDVQRLLDGDGGGQGYEGDD